MRCLCSTREREIMTGHRFPESGCHGWLFFLVWAMFLSQSSELPTPEVVGNGVENSKDTKESTTKPWPNGRIPFAMDPGLPEGVRGPVLSAMAELETDVAHGQHKCISFVPRTDEVDYVLVSPGERGGKADIGFMANGSQILSISEDSTFRGLIKHELLHVLGFYHEQNRADRDKYIDINVTNLLDPNDFKIKYNNLVNRLDTPYDLTSIMHYGAYILAKDERWPAVTPKPAYATGLIMGQASGLSKIDVIRVQRLYGCFEDTNHITAPFSGDRILFYCTFDKDLCAMIIQYPNKSEMLTALAPDGSINARTADVFGVQNNEIKKSGYSSNTIYGTWTIKDTPIEKGPQAGATNGLDSFLQASKAFQRDSEQQIGRHQRETLAEMLKDESYTDSDIPLSRVHRKHRFENKFLTIDNEKLHRTSVSTILTPPIISKQGVICTRLQVVQTNFSSFLKAYVKVAASGNWRSDETSFENFTSNSWTRAELSFAVPTGEPLQLVLQAFINDGSVAVDQVVITDGPCE